jgi:hypothetical protein
MSNLLTRLPNLRKIDASQGLGYLRSLLEGNDLLRFVELDGLTHAGDFFAHAPESADLNSANAFNNGFLGKNYKLEENSSVLIDFFTNRRNILAILDPYFGVSELSEACDDTITIETAAGAWQFAPSSSFLCCKDACNFFFPLIFFVRMSFNSLPNDDSDIYTYVFKHALAIIVEAFDNDGFLLWQRSDSKAIVRPNYLAEQ